MYKRQLLRYGFVHITLCDIRGILTTESEDLDPVRKEVVALTEPVKRSGTLGDALEGADIFVGVSAPEIVTPQMIASMNTDAICFAMANPVPEIMPCLLYTSRCV